jgi:SPP1 gp7 family putative phage head morphogenesis protein
VPVLLQIWANAWELGVQSARRTTGYQGQPNNQAYQNMLNRYQSQWVNQITSTVLKGIAALLVAGATAAAITALLVSITSAAMVAQTEITRAMAAGAAEVYRLNGDTLVEWVTAEDDHVCPLCDANEAAGPHFLGQAFPSGATAPPQHPRCRCALIPVKGEL